MTKAIHKLAAHPAIITVGELIDELCRLPDTAVVSFRCPMLDQELAFYRLRKRSKDLVEVEVNAYPESPPVVPADGALSCDEADLSRLGGARKCSPPQGKRLKQILRTDGDRSV